MSKLIDMTGMRFGRLTVAHVSPIRGKDNALYWDCICDCGKSKRIKGADMRNGKVTSCGCWKDEKTGARFRKHGDSNSKLYNVWTSMKGRCLRKDSKDYHLYGERGVTVCEEWRNDYSAFQSWALSHGYADGLLLDRRDNDGDYCPDNCRWVDDFVQANNRRDNRYVEYRGKTYSMSDLSRIAVVSYTTLRTRLNLGWSVEDAVNIPAVKGRNQHGVAL